MAETYRVGQVRYLGIDVVEIVDLLPERNTAVIEGLARSGTVPMTSLGRELNGDELARLERGMGPAAEPATGPLPVLTIGGATRAAIVPETVRKAMSAPSAMMTSAVALPLAQQPALPPAPMQRAGAHPLRPGGAEQEQGMSPTRIGTDSMASAHTAPSPAGGLVAEREEAPEAEGEARLAGHGIERAREGGLPESSSAATAEAGLEPVQRRPGEGPSTSGEAPGPGPSGGTMGAGAERGAETGPDAAAQGPSGATKGVAAERGAQTSTGPEGQPVSPERRTEIPVVERPAAPVRAGAPDELLAGSRAVTVTTPQSRSEAQPDEVTVTAPVRRAVPRRIVNAADALTNGQPAAGHGGVVATVSDPTRRADEALD